MCPEQLLLISKVTKEDTGTLGAGTTASFLFLEKSVFLFAAKVTVPAFRSVACILNQVWLMHILKRIWHRTILH